LSLRPPAIEKATKKTYLELEIDRDRVGKKEHPSPVPSSSELATKEQKGCAVDFLRSTGVGRTVPREDGEDEEDQDGTSESSGAEG